jgi:hypothetical protein
MYQYQQQPVVTPRRPAPPIYAPEETEREKTNQILQDRFGNHLLQQGLLGEEGLPALAMDSLEGVDAWLSSNGMAIACMEGAAASGADFQMPQTPGRPMPEAVRLKMEAYFQHDFSGVRIHDDDATVRAVNALGASAFAAGHHIYLGHYAEPWTAPINEQVLRHELAHVVQYDEGRAAPGLLSPDSSQEAEARLAEDPEAWIDRLLQQGAGSTLREAEAPLWMREDPEICSQWANSEFMASEEDERLRASGFDLLPLDDRSGCFDQLKEGGSLDGNTFSGLINFSACDSSGENLDGGLTLPPPSEPQQLEGNQLARLLQLTIGTLYTELNDNPQTYTALGEQFYMDLYILKLLAETEAIQHLPWLPLYPFFLDLTFLERIFPSVTTPLADVATVLKFLPLNSLQIGAFDHASEDSILTMIQNQWAADFDHFFTSRHPVITGDSDYQSYIAARRDDGVDPMRYANALPDVRSLHWFEKSVLDKLVYDRLTTDTNRPVTVLLVSAQDHNGALQRNEGTAAVILEPEHRALLAQGMGALTEFQPLLEEWAATYTDDGQFEEVLFNGHGNPLGMELAAKTDDAGNKESAEGLSYTGATAAESHRLLSWLGEHTEVGGAVALAACSTNAEPFDPQRLPQDLAIWDTELPPPQIAAEQMSWEEVREQILAPSTFAEQLALDFPNQHVTGANGLLRPQVGRDAGGNLSLSGGYDPNIFGDKVAYITTGGDPVGVTKALIHVAALASPETALMLMRNRAATPSPTALRWDDRVVRWTCDLILLNASTRPDQWLIFGNRAQALVLLGARGADLPSCDRDLGALLNSIELLLDILNDTAVHLSTRLRFAQLLAENGAGMFTHLRELLDNNAPDRTIPTLDGDYLKGHIHEMYSYDISPGSLILALLWHQHTGSPDAKAWLEAAQKSYPNFQGIPAASDILRHLPYVP